MLSFEVEKIKVDFEENSLTLFEFYEFEKLIKFVLKKQKDDSLPVTIPRNILL